MTPERLTEIEQHQTHVGIGPLDVFPTTQESCIICELLTALREMREEIVAGNHGANMRLAILLGSYRASDELHARHADAWKIGEELVRQGAITRNFHERYFDECVTCFDFHQKQFHDFAKKTLPDLLAALREAQRDRNEMGQAVADVTRRALCAEAERDALQRRMEAWEKVFRGL